MPDTLFAMPAVSVGIANVGTSVATTAELTAVVTNSLQEGDLAYIKLVGRLAHLGRRATIAEVEEFYAPYAPYRGLAGVHTLTGLHHLVAQGGPQSLAA